MSMIKLQRLGAAALFTCAVLLAPLASAEQSTTVIPSSGPETFGGVVTNRLNPAFRSLLSNSSGSAAPANGPGATALAYQFWVDTSTSPSVLKIYDGSSWLALATIDPSGHILALPNAVLTGTPKTPGFTGYLYANGSGGWTAATTIPTTALSGPLQAANFPAITGDCSITAGALSITCSKFGGTPFGSAAGINYGTSGGVLGPLNANKTDSGSNTFSGASNSFTGVTYMNAPVMPNTKLLSFGDANGTYGTFGVQSDNNLVLAGTDGAGNSRAIFYIFMRNGGGITFPVGITSTTIGAGGNTAPGNFTTLGATGALSFPPNSVPASYLAQIGAKTILGNSTGAAGNVAAGSLSSFVDAETANTTQGSVLFRGSAGLKAFTCGTSGYFLRFNGAADIDCAASTSATPPQPQVTSYLSGSGTYTTPTGATRLEIEGIAGGQGGQGGGTSNPVGGAGGDTTFGSLLAPGGNSSSTLTGLGSFTAFSRGTGNYGTSSPGTSANGSGGTGGNGIYGGAGAGGRGTGTPVATAGSTNSGAGGGGGGASNVAGANGGAGGQSGTPFKTIINAPAASYSYAIGAAGTAGTAGTSGAAGAAGAAGYLRIVAYFN